LQSDGLANVISGNEAARHEIKEEDCVNIKHEPMEDRIEVKC
jgi:hypothetical protein